jgi:hypothetical protein
MLAVLAVFAPDIVWHTPATLPWSHGEYQGHDGVQEYFASFAAQLTDARIVPDELYACGDRVVALGFERARAGPTGVAFAAEFVHVWTLRDGLVVRLHGVVDTAIVRQAFGLQPAPMGAWAVGG